MQALDEPPIPPIGRIKSFGPFGPKYEVGEIIDRVVGHWMVEIIMVDSGEKEAYRWSSLIDDPDAS